MAFVHVIVDGDRFWRSLTKLAEAIPPNQPGLDTWQSARVFNVRKSPIDIHHTTVRSLKLRISKQFPTVLAK